MAEDRTPTRSKRSLKHDIANPPNPEPPSPDQQAALDALVAGAQAPEPATPPEKEQKPSQGQDEPKWRVRPEERDLYSHLAAHFKNTMQDNRGGVDLTYVTGGQCQERLNQTLGPLGWSFEIVHQGLHTEADEFYVHGRMTIYRQDGYPITREQYGSQKIKRRRDSGVPLDIGFDLKGAATDALKKCAASFGVALYLSKNTDAAEVDAEEMKRIEEAQAAKAPKSTAPKPAPASHGETRLAPSQQNAPPPPLTCMHASGCQTRLGSIQTRTGEVWSPQHLADEGAKRFGRVLCAGHFRSEAQALAQGSKSPSPKANGQHAWQPWAAGAFSSAVLAMLNATERFTPLTQTVKKGFYASLSGNLRMTRNAAYQKLHMDPERNHLEDWLQAADIGTESLYSLLMQCSLFDDLVLPSIEELNAARGR